jgi:hypothetical protein
VRRRRVGYVFQDLNLLPSLTTGSWIEGCPTACHTPRSWIEGCRPAMASIRTTTAGSGEWVGRGGCKYVNLTVDAVVARR